MSLADRLDAEPSGVARDVVRGRKADVLADIHCPGTGAAIWARSPDAGFQNWIDALPIRCLPEMNTVVPVETAKVAVLSACEAAGLPDGSMRDVLAGDVAALALIAGRLLEVSEVRIRLDVACDVMCPKFHIDAVSARLLCTYRGPGTQYVPEGLEDVPRRVRQVRTGAVALFRGRLWPGAERTGLLHRSPDPDRKTGGARLLLVIDPLA